VEGTDLAKKAVKQGPSS